MKAKTKETGFTLVELITALTIAGILTVIAVPSFLTLIKKHRLISNAENLYSTLQFARSEAVKRNTNVYVSLTTGDNWCYGVSTTNNCNCAVANSCNLGSFQATNTQQTSLSVSGFASNLIQFENTHAAANASGSVTFTTYGASTAIQINISRFGSVKICSNDISEYSSC